MRAIEKLLSKANSVLLDPRTELVNLKNKKIIDGAYDGYINGFGPTVITSGLIPTLATFAADTKKQKVLDAIAQIASIDNKINSIDLLNHCLAYSSDQAKLWLWKEKIINASIALKLMIRTFDITD